MSAVRLLLLLAACGFLFPQALPASSEAKVKSESGGYFDFPTCVRYALVHSQDFLKNRLEIQILSADLKDAHSELIPTLNIVTRYYLATASNQLSNPLNVQFFITNWDPYLALLKIKSSGILVDIGTISHYDKISDNISQMAKIFYRIHVLEKTIRAHKQLMALHQNKVSYGQSRHEQGAVDPLEVRLWTNNLRGERVKLKSLEAEMEEKSGQLKMIMGYHPDYYLPLDTRDAANQILAGFNGQLVTFAEIQAGNMPLKILAKKEQLQSNRTTGAYLALIPKPIFVLEDVQNQVDRTSGFNMALGLDYTVWDGFKHVRDIKRQKMKAEQLKIDRDKFSQSLYNQFKRLRGELDLSGEREGFYREQATLAELTEEKAFLQYKAGELTYEQYVEKRLEKVQAYVDSLSSLEGRVTSLIDLATIAGGLNKYNAGIRY
ncbi:MAG: TolC family protein [Desulfomonilaceae bacterium]